MKKGFTLVELLVVIVIIGIGIGFMVGVGMLLKGCSHLQEKGLKNVATGIWEGSESSEGSDNTNALPTE